MIAAYRLMGRKAESPVLRCAMISTGFVQDPAAHFVLCFFSAVLNLARWSARASTGALTMYGFVRAFTTYIPHASRLD